MKASVTELRLIPVVATFLLINIAGDVFAQKKSDEPDIIKGDANSCELNAVFLDVLWNMARESSDRLFVIARRGESEPSRLLNHRRLQSVRDQLVRRQIAAERIVFAEGEPIKGKGQVEFYFGSRLVFVSLAMPDGGLCLDCCEDPPIKPIIRKRRRRKNATLLKSQNITNACLNFNYILSSASRS